MTGMTGTMRYMAGEVIIQHNIRKDLFGGVSNPLAISMNIYRSCAGKTIMKKYETRIFAIQIESSVSSCPAALQL